MTNAPKDRLKQLVDEAGGRPAFARKVWRNERDPYGANKAKLSNWLAGNVEISSSEAKRIAERFHRRAGWLVYGELPERVGVTRSEAELADDLANYVVGRLESEFGSTMFVDGAQLLDRIVGDEAHAVEAWENWQHHLDHVPGILKHAAKHVTFPALSKWLLAHAKRLRAETPNPPQTRPPLVRPVWTGSVGLYPSPPSDRQKSAKARGESAVLIAGAATIKSERGTKKAQSPKQSQKRKRRNAS